MQEQMDEMAAMMRTLKKRQDDEYAAAKFYETLRHHSMASMEDMAAMTTKGSPDRGADRTRAAYRSTRYGIY
ncbi:hypothetical protein DVH05_026094 [Phytophthora capsici]|nr:hypothetical protein DVH05_026094 [Phytophthora capsici]